MFLALLAMAGKAQIVCHVEGEIMSNKYGARTVPIILVAP